MVDANTLEEVAALVDKLNTLKGTGVYVKVLGGGQMILGDDEVPEWEPETAYDTVASLKSALLDEAISVMTRMSGLAADGAYSYDVRVRLMVKMMQDFVIPMSG